MKVNVEIDCTPLEARQFMGLPDVQPMQNAVMDKEKGRLKGLAQFLDEKSFRPGLGAYRRDD